MQSLKKLVKTKKIKNFFLLTIVSLLLSSSIFFIVFSAPPTSPYAPGETLNPSCSPGDLNCTVSPPLSTYISTTTIVELNNNLLSFNTGTVKILGELIVTNTTTFNGINYRWPSSSPNANQFLQADGSGGLQWVDITSSTSGGWTDEGTLIRLQTITDSVAIGTTTQIGKFVVATGTQIGLVIDNLGLVGIGTTAPAYKLDVNGDLRVVATTTLGSLILSGFTPGSILFAGSGGQISQNNSNFYWDNTNLRLGIGTITPTAKLHIIGDLIVSATSSLGTITSGIWQGNVIGINYGGTGLSSLGSANQILGVNSGGTALEYKNISSLLTAGQGISINGTTNATISNTGVLSLNSLTGALALQGTTNQINVSSGGSTITLSTPQDIATTSAPTFSGLTLAGNLLPSTNLNYDLGSSTLQWRNLYVGTTTIGSTITIGSNNFKGTGTTTLFTTSNSNQLVLGANGYVGIGSGMPSQKLTVEGDIGLSGFGLDGTRFIGTIHSAALSLRTNNENRIYITLSGLVGIRTTTPSALLHVYGSTTLGSATSTPINFVGYVNSDIIPFTDNTYSLGASGYRWANIYAGTTTIGDLVFANNFRIIEFNSTNCGLFGENCNLQGINLKNHNNQDILSIDENGNLKIKGDIIIGSNTLEGTEIINLFETIKNILNNFTEKVRSSLASLGVVIENGFMRVKELIADILRVKNIKELESFEMKDKATGEIYCVWLEYGEFRKVKGSCEENSSSGQNKNPSRTTSSSSQGESTSLGEQRGSDSSSNNQGDLTFPVNQKISSSSSDNQGNSGSTSSSSAGESLNYSSSSQDSSNSSNSQ